jgi:polysaccharide deacetylase 2 family uncharacterized protein YibQ
MPLSDRETSEDHNRGPGEIGLPAGKTDPTRRSLLLAFTAMVLPGAAQAVFRGTIDRSATAAATVTLPVEPAMQQMAMATSPTVDSRPATAGRGQSRAVLTIVIDDIGNRLAAGRRTIALPVTCSFLPHTSHCRELVEEAYGKRREIILHTPMESIHGNRLGPGGLTVDMSSREIFRTMRDNFASVPHASGVSNHMGSLFTSQSAQMEAVMQTLSGDPSTFFVDSLTTSDSVAWRVARSNGVAAARRNIFLDHIRDPAQIRRQLYKLVDRALRRGSALGIGHPYPETLSVLEAELPAVTARGIELVSARQLISIQRGGRL